MANLPEKNIGIYKKINKFIYIYKTYIHFFSGCFKKYPRWVFVPPKSLVSIFINATLWDARVPRIQKHASSSWPGSVGDSKYM